MLDLNLKSYVYTEDCAGCKCSFRTILLEELFLDRITDDFKYICEHCDTPNQMYNAPEVYLGRWDSIMTKSLNQIPLPLPAQIVDRIVVIRSTTLHPESQVEAISELIRQNFGWDSKQRFNVVDEYGPRSDLDLAFTMAGIEYLPFSLFVNEPYVIDETLPFSNKLPTRFL